MAVANSGGCSRATAHSIMARPQTTNDAHSEAVFPRLLVPESMEDGCARCTIAGAFSVAGDVGRVGERWRRFWVKQRARLPRDRYGREAYVQSSAICASPLDWRTNVEAI